MPLGFRGEPASPVLLARGVRGGASDSDPTVRGDAAANGLKMAQEGHRVGLIWRPGRRLPG